MSVATGRVASIHRFPVKSMLGEDLGSAVLGERGLVGDRGYALVDADDGVVASGKHPRKWAALLRMSASYVAEPTAEDLPPVEITLADGTRVRSDDADVDRRLTDAVGRPVRLSRAPAAKASFEEVWPDLEGLAPQGFIDGTRTGTEDDQAVSTIPLGALAPPQTFFDLAVLHVLTTGTLERLADLAPEADFDPRRYRPNLVLETGEGFVEDAWVGTCAGLGQATRIRFSMVTMRCVMTTLAQRDLDADAGTLRAIAKHHRLEIPELGTWACAGVYACVEEGGRIQVGDRLG